MSDHAPLHIVAASALVRRGDGAALLVRTHRRGWEMPGGQIEIGESLIAGLKREVYEESGIRIEVGRLAVVRSNLSRSIVIFGFEARYLSGDLRPSEETPDVRWVSVDEAQRLVTHAAVSQSLRDMLARHDEVIYRAYRNHPYELVSSSLDH